MGVEGERRGLVEMGFLGKCLASVSRVDGDGGVGGSDGLLLSWERPWAAC